MTLEDIYNLAGKLKATSSLSQKLVVLSDTQAFKRSKQDWAPRWAAAIQSGLLEVLLRDLANPWMDTPLLRQLIVKGGHAISTCLIWGTETGFEGAPKQLFTQYVPVIFRQFLATIEDLEGSQGGAGMTPTDLGTLRSMTAMLTGQCLMVSGYDETLVVSIDKDALLRLIVFVLFDHGDYFPESAREASIQAYGRAISSDSFQYYVIETPQNSIVQDLLKRVSPDEIAAKCASMWLFATGPHTARGLATLFMLIHHRDAPEIHRAFVKQGVCKAIIQGHWKLLKQPGLPNHDTMEQGRVRMMVITRILYNLYDFGGAQRGLPAIIGVMTELLNDADLLLFVGKALLAPKYLISSRDDQINESTERLRWWGYWIGRACQKTPELMYDVCRPAWTHVMHGLLHLDRCNLAVADEMNTTLTYRRFEFAIEQWRLFGEEIRSADTRDIPGRPYWTPRSDDRLSCSWVRCLLYQSDPAGGAQPSQDMLRCTRCQRVQYCGEACQRRHWVSGHRIECD